MNYLAHGHHFVDQPYFLAGTAVPDWLGVVDRRVRLRRRHALPFTDHADGRIAALAGGIVQHHLDDARFHGTAAFAQLCLALTRLVRPLMPQDNGFRPAFLGHLLVEVLLDAELIAARPGVLESYYQALQAVDIELVTGAVGRMASHPVDGLADLMVRFSDERFLSDYGDDAKLCRRLNQVLSRVNLPPLPDSFVSFLPAARRQVGQKKDQLLMAPARATTADPVGQPQG